MGNIRSYICISHFAKSILNALQQIVFLIQEKCKCKYEYKYFIKYNENTKAIINTEYIGNIRSYICVSHFAKSILNALQQIVFSLVCSNLCAFRSKILALNFHPWKNNILHGANCLKDCD